MADKNLVKIAGDGLEILCKDGNTVRLSDILKGEPEAIGIYFSAHWCPPCRAFTPVLAEFYKRMFGKGRNFEVIFVSGDRDESSFKQYYREMPWKALPFSDQAMKDELGRKYEVTGIPALILLDSKGNMYSKDGRGKLMHDQHGSRFPWK